MIERTGPYDKPPRQPADFARKHPIRNFLSNLVAIAFGIIILVSFLSVMSAMIGAI